MAEERRTARLAAWGVATLLFGGGAFATWPVAVAPNSTFPIWPTYVFAGIAALTLYMCFATILSWWPTARSGHGSSTGTAELAAADRDSERSAMDSGTLTGQDESAGNALVSLQPPPVAVRLMPELDVASNRLRLTVMVDVDGLRMLPGSSPSNQLISWAYANPDGNSVADTARDLLTQLCEYALHLDAFDQTLAALNDA